MANLAEILSKPAKDFKAPPVLPKGKYIGVISGPHKSVTSSRQTPGLEFNIALQQAMGDVDQAALAEIGGATGKTMRHTMYITDNSAFYLKQFLVDHLGIEEGEKSIAELLAEAPGKTVGVDITNQPSKDGTRMVHFISGTFKV